MRGIFFDEGDAAEVQRRLRADGFTGELSRIRYAGEDDDEDHPWAVETDAPAFALELLIDRFDGWLDEEPAPAPPPRPPSDLPDGPRRHHRPPERG